MHTEVVNVIDSSNTILSNPRLCSMLMQASMVTTLS